MVQIHKPCSFMNNRAAVTASVRFRTFETLSQKFLNTTRQTGYFFPRSSSHQIAITQGRKPPRQCTMNTRRVPPGLAFETWDPPSKGQFSRSKITKDTGSARRPKRDML
jgi:hypothetical protein